MYVKTEIVYMFKIFFHSDLSNFKPIIIIIIWR